MLLLQAMTLSIFSLIIVLLMAAVATTVVFRYLRIPVILGYIVVGVLLGPHAVGLIADGQNIRDIAEFGVVFLLFTIGLELSW